MFKHTKRGIRPSLYSFNVSKKKSFSSCESLFEKYPSACISTLMFKETLWVMKAFQIGDIHIHLVFLLKIFHDDLIISDPSYEYFLDCKTLITVCF